MSDIHTREHFIPGEWVRLPTYPNMSDDEQYAVVVGTMLDINNEKFNVYVQSVDEYADLYDMDMQTADIHYGIDDSTYRVLLLDEFGLPYMTEDGYEPDEMVSVMLHTQSGKEIINLYQLIIGDIYD